MTTAPHSRNTAFFPRVLRDVSGRSQATTLFSENYDAPFGIDPMGLGSLSGYRSDIILVCAAAKANIPMIVSGSSLIRMEKVIKEKPEGMVPGLSAGGSRTNCRHG